MSVASTNVTASSSPAHHAHYSDDYYTVPDDLAHSEHYIYVTYPPDLKRRLLERFAHNFRLASLTNINLIY